MSTMNPLTNAPTTDSPSAVRERVGAILTRSVETAAFWTAVALPFLYLPLLVGGLTGQEAIAFAALLVANAVALVAGHDHRRDD